jgi:hypothetical protein
MNRPAVIVSMIVVLAGSSAAMAGGYLGAGIGDDPAIDADNEALEPDGRSGRLLVGYRFGIPVGAISIEGAYSGHSVAAGNYKARELSVSGKYNFPLGSNFEVFGRLGLQRTSLTARKDSMYDLAGNGYLLGPGLEYRFDLGSFNGSLWLDYTYHHADELVGDRRGTEWNARMWTLGFTIGL